MNDLLKQYFGYDEFRPGQKKLSRKSLIRKCIRNHAYRKWEINLLPASSFTIRWAYCGCVPFNLFDEGSGGRGESIRYTRHFYQ